MYMKQENFNYMDITKFDWKKHANAQMKEQEAELAFAKLANSIVEEKAGPMFRNPFLQGFEIVSTNGSFTRMIGIFVFRVEKNLFYVPVFYINGDLKGATLLYSVDDKLFTLLSPEWCEYYINKVETSEAETVKPDSPNKGVQDLEMRWLAYPPYMSKGASTKLVRRADYKPESVLSIFGLIKEAKEALTKEDYEEACTNWKNDNRGEGKHLVRSLVKKGGYEMFDKLASWIENDEDFASNFVNLCDFEKDLMQKDVLADQKYRIMSANATTKIAAINDANHPGGIKKGKNQIRIYKGRFNPFTNKTAAEQIADGYSIEDTREEKKLQPVILNPKQQFNGIDCGVGYGVYDMLTSEGDIKRVFIISGNSDNKKRPALILDADKGEDSEGLLWYDTVFDSKNLLGREDGRSIDPAGVHTQDIPFSEILANRVLDDNYDKTTIAKFLKDKPEVGKIYAIFDSKNSYLSDEAFFIKDIQDNPDGGYTISAYPTRGYQDLAIEELDRPWNEMTIKVNNYDRKNILVDLKIFNKSTQWVKIPFRKQNINRFLKEEANADDSLSTKPKDWKIIMLQQDYVPGTLSDFYKLTSEFKIKQASIKYNQFNDTYTLSSAYHQPKALNKIASTVQLMHDFNYSQSDAEELLKFAEENKSKEPYKFFYKTAARIILNPDPDWFKSYDSDLGVKVESPETRVLSTQSFEEDAPAPRFGDHMPTLTDVVNQTTVPIEESRITDDNKVSDIVLQTASPNMLADIAQATGKTSLFEHGIIGSLAKAKDTSVLIADYLPDLYQGNDKLGRLIFLLYVSPQLFIDFYGSDDISDLENNLLSIFKQQGELILELSKRTKTKQVNVTTVENIEK